MANESAGRRRRPAPPIPPDRSSAVAHPILYPSVAQIEATLREMQRHVEAITGASSRWTGKAYIETERNRAGRRPYNGYFDPTGNIHVHGDLLGDEVWYAVGLHELLHSVSEG